MPQTPVPPVPLVPPGEGLARSNPEKAIELIQAQIAGVKKEISDLTGQLVPGTSDARENAIDDQLGNAHERLESLNRQLDRVVSGDFNQVIEIPGSPPDPNDIPHGVRNVIESGLVAIVLVVLGLPLVRMIARRLEPKVRSESPESGARFERLEQAVDAVAIEIERVSEGQRYTNKLLGDLRALPAPNAMEQWPQQARVAERVERGNP